MISFVLFLEQLLCTRSRLSLSIDVEQMNDFESVQVALVSAEL